MIKLISLLNLIANGNGKIPTKIKWLGEIYTYNALDYTRKVIDPDLDLEVTEYLMDHVALTTISLNEMVEIISYE